MAGAVFGMIFKIVVLLFLLKRYGKVFLNTKFLRQLIYFLNLILLIFQLSVWSGVRDIEEQLWASLVSLKVSGQLFSAS